MRVDLRRPAGTGGEAPISRLYRNGAVRVPVGIERGAETMDKGYRPEAGRCGYAATGGFEPILHGIQEDPQNRSDERGLIVEDGELHALRRGGHPVCGP